MKLRIEIDEADLKELVRKHLSNNLGMTIELKDIQIETKSAQNYKSEWEKANFRARYEK